MFETCYCTIQNQVLMFLGISGLQKVNFEKSVKLKDKIMCLAK